jgi:hypothetical protein
MCYMDVDAALHSIGLRLTCHTFTFVKLKSRRIFGEFIREVGWGVLLVMWSPLHGVVDFSVLQL